MLFIMTCAPCQVMPLMNSPEEFQQNYQRDLPIWKHLVEAAGARLD